MWGFFMNKEQRDQIVELLIPYIASQQNQRALIEAALFDAPKLKADIETGLTAREFALFLIDKCLAYGEIETGEPALSAILDQIHGRVGKGKQREVEQLQKDIQHSTQTKIPIGNFAITETSLPQPTEPQTEDHIFIAYDTKDGSAFVEDLEAELRRKGYQLWVHFDIIGGEDWQLALSKAINQAAIVLVILTPHSVHSKWLQAEVQLARRLNKHIIPIIASPFIKNLSDENDSSPNDNIQALRVLGLERRQYRHFQKLGFKAGLERILSDFTKLSIIQKLPIDLDKDNISRIDITASLEKTDIPTPLGDAKYDAAARDENKPYVFISYARPDQEWAEKIQYYFETKNVRVFRDATDIRSGQGWDITIEKALRATTHMILILSPDSMPYRKEVYREWFFFDQKNKPIHGLYVKSCELHSRLFSYHYVDVAQHGDGSAFQELLTAILEDSGTQPQDTQSVTTLSPDNILIDRIIVAPNAEIRALHQSLDNLYDMIKQETISNEVEEDSKRYFNPNDLNLVIQHNPSKLRDYHVARYAEWSQSQYNLDNRYVELELAIEQNREILSSPSTGAESNFSWTLSRITRQFDDELVMVLLGDAGSGKSTLLRRFQMDICQEQIRTETDEGQIPLYIQLGDYNTSQTPFEWLETLWNQRFSNLGEITEYYQTGRFILLADGLNELQHDSEQAYHNLIAKWLDFAWQMSENGNRTIFSCRNTDYLSLSLKAKPWDELTIHIQPMNEKIIGKFLAVYLPKQKVEIVSDIARSPQYDYYRIPIFLRLLTKQIEANGQGIPAGRAALFTRFIHETLRAEINRKNALFHSDHLLTDTDRAWIKTSRFEQISDLTDEGTLFTGLTNLAKYMHQLYLDGKLTKTGLPYEEAQDEMQVLFAPDVIQASVILHILVHDKRDNRIKFWHRMFREYFVARAFAQQPNFDSVKVEWRSEHLRPSFLDYIASARPQLLPPLHTTGWEDIVTFAASMVPSPDEFIDELATYNLTLAARCLLDEGVTVMIYTKDRIREKLHQRATDSQTDLRARIDAREILMELGHPEFKSQQGLHGEYIIPPTKTCASSEYALAKEHTPISLKRFSIGIYPVTVAEYQHFVEADGYKQEKWWRTSTEQLNWWRGFGAPQGLAEEYRNHWHIFRANPKLLKSLQKDENTKELAHRFRYLITQSEKEFEEWLDKKFSKRKPVLAPSSSFDISTFNHPSYPIVGISWYEALAYCNWLSAQENTGYMLPSELEWETAARGQCYTDFPFNDEPNPSRYNTHETRIGKPTPVGVFIDGTTPDGIHDISGNVFEWTRSLDMPAPYNPTDGRESIGAKGNRIIRGGSWLTSVSDAKITKRTAIHPEAQSKTIGFRLLRYDTN